MTKENEKKVPKLRFKGFTDDWEQRELKNLVTRVKSYSLSRSVETNSDTNTKYIHYGDIHTHVADKIEKGTKLPNIVPGVYETLNKGDLVLADASEDYQGIATPAIVMTQPDYSLVSGLHTIALRPTKINSLYLYYLIKSPTFRKYGYKVGTGMKVFGISVNRLLEFKTLMPVTVEQSKIAELLLLMDKTITLHQRKLEQLEKLKQALLEQLFPQKDEVVPRLRFVNFSDVWEQRRFIDFLDDTDGIRRGPFGSALKKDLFVPESDYVIYEQQNAIYDHFDTRYNISKEKFDELHRFKLEPGDFIMSGAGTIGRISRVPKGIKQGVFNQALIRFKIKNEVTDSDFFLQWIRSDNMQRKFTDANPGSAMTNLVPLSEVKQWRVLVPAKEEQRLLGKILTVLDNLLTLHHHKFNQLKLFKKELLQQMFI
ncbi:restriction endonuclease subunit S [Aerococcus viridans]